MVNLNPAIQKEKNAKAYKALSDIIKEEIKRTDLNVLEYYPKELPLFSFSKNYDNVLLGKIKNFFVRMMNLEPLFVDGGPPYPHIIVRDNNYLNFAERLAQKYAVALYDDFKLKMTIEFASKNP